MTTSFHVEGTTPLLESHVFSVERRHVVAGDERFERDIATHPGAVAILAIDDHGRIGVISQYRAAFDRYTYEIPAGTQDHVGEDPLDTAKRELVEEMGCRAASWRLLGRFLNSPGWPNQVMTVFEATDLAFVERAPEGPEELGSTIQWMSPTELKAVLATEPAIDSTMAAALHRVFGTFFE